MKILELQGGKDSVDTEKREEGLREKGNYIIHNP